MSDEIARLVADVFELAGLLRRSGEVVAAREGHTQARWQLLSVVSDRALTVPQAARRLGVTRQGVQRVATIWSFAAWPSSDTTPTTAHHHCWC